jgi:predicted nuclease with TOPRIM domain
VSQNEAAELRSTVSVRSAQIEKLTQEVEWLRSELSQVQRGAPVVPDASVQLKAEFKSVDEKLQVPCD